MAPILTKVMGSSIQCEHPGCSVKVNDPHRTTFGYHKRHTRMVPSYIPYTSVIFVNNIVQGKEASCYQLEPDVDLGIPTLSKTDISKGSLCIWKLPCRNRTQKANTNRNRDNRLSQEEIRVVKQCQQQKTTLVIFSSTAGQPLSPFLPHFFYLTIRTRENVLNGTSSIDPRVEYLTIYSQDKNKVLSMASHFWSFCGKDQRQFHDYYQPPTLFHLDTKFTPKQIQNHELFLSREGKEKNLYIFGGFGSEFARDTRRRSCHALKYTCYHVFISKTQRWHKMSVTEFLQIRNLPPTFVKYGIKTLYSIVHPRFLSIFL